MIIISVILEVKDIKYSYVKKKSILRGVNQCFEAGKMYAIIGPSGCGKTTLLSLLGGLDSPSEGSILFQGQSIDKGGLNHHRKENVAFVFQSFNLIDYLSPIENVRLTAKTEPNLILAKLGFMPEEMKRSVLQLSGGQQQRVAVARALASGAALILADEPTGNLDEDTAASITKLLKESANDHNRCVIVVTHSADVARQADFAFRLKRGVLEPA